ncbi:glycosyltransferase family 4 protein [Desmospora activa]|uniref:Glycosyltransferase involved in cell wall biosynthesis n=1 Tax=Desmospora activa DSM 45169 TaxID=1121389 RepID=A0A2T4ZBT6_9BACL|nr:glycosyltransferase family 1 protein [Desmospora activa]PTM59348.1 glycosyltransferase involved in cell wall biosynthesis [Desmospora activa DSM 45169]
MKIALFTDTFPPQVNGVSLTLQRWVAHMEQRQVETRVFVPRCTAEDLEAPGVRRSRSIPLFFYPEHRLSFPNPFVIRRELREFQPDLIHVTTPFNMGLMGLHIAKKEGIPLVASYHTHFDRYLQYYGLQFLSNWIWHYMRWFHESCEMMLAPSQETKNLLEEEGFSRVELWRRGVDTQLFHPGRANDAFRQRYHIEQRRILLYVGRIAPEKDLDVLVEAIKRLPENQRDHVHWVLVGDGPMRAELEAEALPSVTLTGTLRGEALAEAYASADCFVFPSTTETFGNVVLESLAAGTPAVVARTGGVKELVEHGRTGWCTSPRSVEGLIEGIQFMLAEPTRLSWMGIEARRYALEQSWDRIFDGLLARYQGVVAQKLIQQAHAG